MTPLQLHIESWKDCTRCELSKTRVKVVIGKGDVPCRLLLVGEAPGKSENVSGKPFHGPAGHLLESILVEAGLATSTDGRVTYKYPTAFTNVVACMPIDEETGEKTNKPKPECVKACLPRLKEFVEISKPEVIVAVGLLASTWLDQSYSKAVQVDVPVVDILHPAAILRAKIVMRPGLVRRTTITLRDQVLRLLQSPI